jgi:hypothetical protein
VDDGIVRAIANDAACFGVVDRSRINPISNTFDKTEIASHNSHNALRSLDVDQFCEYCEDFSAVDGSESRIKLPQSQESPGPPAVGAT